MTGRRRGLRVAVVGGGAAGFFAAITCAETNPAASVTIFEGARQTLGKVRISGGGRCNVTANCLDPAELVNNYPRGHSELRGPFSHFGPRDTCAWFEKRGVRLVTESDGRVFPVSNRADSVVECLENAARRVGVACRTSNRVRRVDRLPDGAFLLFATNPEPFDRVLLATGSASLGYRLAASLGHCVVAPVPSLFTFRINDVRLSGLAGLSVSSATLKLTTQTGRPLRETGPLLVTHWGLSGPAVLRLSAWGARQLAESDYRAELDVNWLPSLTQGDVARLLRSRREESGARRIPGDPFLQLPARLWARLAEHARIGADTTWATVRREGLERFSAELGAARFAVAGRGVFKDEFVTCGGVALSEVDFRTLESKVQPRLYLAGEILDIDGITGGYNFQAAWTTGWIAGRAMAAA